MSTGNEVAQEYADNKWSGIFFFRINFFRKTLTILHVMLKFFNIIQGNRGGGLHLLVEHPLVKGGSRHNPGCPFNFCLFLIICNLN